MGTGGTGTGGAIGGGGMGTGGMGTGGMGTGGMGNGGTGGMDPCGNGLIEAGEECDDGDKTDDDGCTMCIVDCPGNATKHSTTHHCYEVLSGSFTYDEAMKACTDLGPGTMLAAPSTLAEFNFLVPLLFTPAWIGGTDVAMEGTWVWANGEPWIYADSQPPWQPGQPNAQGPADDCIQFGSSNDAMFDVNCGNSYNALCERVALGQP